jgi:hypothetical protein
VISGVTVVTNARVYYTPRAAAGAPGARHSLRPLMEGGMLQAKLGRFASRDREALFDVIACDKREAFAQKRLRKGATRERSDEAIHALLCRSMDCFAGARNDGIGCLKFESVAPPMVSSLRTQGPITTGFCVARKSSNSILKR